MGRIKGRVKDGAQVSDSGPSARRVIAELERRGSEETSEYGDTLILKCL